MLADIVGPVVQRGSFPVVLGGDCSILSVTCWRCATGPPRPSLPRRPRRFLSAGNLDHGRSGGYGPRAFHRARTGSRDEPRRPAPADARCGCRDDRPARCRAGRGLRQPASTARDLQPGSRDIAPPGRGRNRARRDRAPDAQGFGWILDPPRRRRAGRCHHAGGGLPDAGWIELGRTCHRPQRRHAQRQGARHQHHDLQPRPRPGRPHRPRPGEQLDPRPHALTRRAAGIVRSEAEQIEYIRRGHQAGRRTW